MSKDLIIKIDYGGLGDHLFFSHIPRIAKLNCNAKHEADMGGYDKVYIHSSSPFRHNDYKRLIWEQNPYVDGFIDQEPTKRDEIDDSNLDECNILDKFMLAYGIDDKNRFHEPEIQYKPKFREEYNKVIFDPNYISNSGDEFTLSDIIDYFYRNNIYIDAVMADLGGKRCFDENVRADFIKTKNLEDFCDLIYSAKALYCFATGIATLAAALGKPVNVFVGPNVNNMFLHSPLHNYIRMEHNNKICKVWEKKFFAFSIKCTLRIKTINRIAKKIIPTQSCKASFKNAFLPDHLYLIKPPFIAHASTTEIEKIIMIAHEISNKDNKTTENKKFSDKSGGGGEKKHIFEFGSRYGEDSTEFAKILYKMGIDSHIWSFECNENTLPRCRAAVSKYPNITLTESAISQSNDFISFYKINAKKTKTTHSDGNQGASSTLKVSGKYPIEQYVQDEVRVKSIRLDTFMKNNNINKIDILWMDIQGGELEALKSLGDRIYDVKLIYTEVEFMEMYENQPLFNDINGYLVDKNFVFIGFVDKNEFFANAIFINKKYYDENIRAFLKENEFSMWITK